MMKQYKNSTPSEDYREILKSQLWLDRMGMMKEALDEAPDQCLVWDASRVSFAQAQINGKRLHISIRRLFWCYLNDEVPAFGQATCKTTGCCNPAHQRIRVVTAPRLISPGEPRRVNVVGSNDVKSTPKPINLVNGARV